MVLCRNGRNREEVLIAGKCRWRQCEGRAFYGAARTGGVRQAGTIHLRAGFFASGADDRVLSEKERFPLTWPLPQEEEVPLSGLRTVYQKLTQCRVRQIRVWLDGMGADRHQRLFQPNRSGQEGVLRRKHARESVKAGQAWSNQFWLEFWVARGLFQCGRVATLPGRGRLGNWCDGERQIKPN